MNFFSTPKLNSKFFHNKHIVVAETPSLLVSAFFCPFFSNCATIKKNSRRLQRGSFGALSGVHNLIVERFQHKFP